MARARCWTLCALALALAPGCRSKPKEKTLSPAEQLEKKRWHTERYWNHEELISARRIRDPAPPKDAVFVELDGQTLVVDYEEVGGTLEAKGGGVDYSQEQFELRYVYRHLLKRVRSHPNHRAASLWVGPTVTGTELARTLVTLKHAGVEDIHVAVQDTQSEARGWILVQDFRGYSLRTPLESFKPEELMPWDRMLERLDPLWKICEAQKRDGICSRNRNLVRTEFVHVTQFAIGFHRFTIESDDRVIAQLHFEKHKPQSLDRTEEYPEALRQLAKGGTWLFNFFGTPHEWGFALGEMYPDGTKLPPLAFPLDLERPL